MTHTHTAPSFLSVLQRLGPDPCNGKDPLHHCKHSSSNGGYNTDGDNTAKSDTTYEEGGSDATSTTGAQATDSYYAYDSASTTGAQADSANYYEEEDEKEAANAGSSAVMSSRLNMWLFATVGSVIAAIGAIHIGQRKNPNGARGRHAMTGVISRRATLVSAFATGLMPSKETPLANEGVEVSPGLSLDYSPSGEVEMQPGYNLA
jgi:hypothetical protein